MSMHPAIHAFALANAGHDTRSTQDYLGHREDDLFARSLLIRMTP
jgi:hypothetical protein